MEEIRLIKVDKDSIYERDLIEFVKTCSWNDAKEHIAWMIENWVFTDWESMFVAVCDETIVGFCSIMKTDYYPLPEIYPWISCVYVEDEYRGNRISEKLISFANQYAKECGFKKTYIPTEYVGLYEKYGYCYVKDVINYGGGVDRLLEKSIE